MVRKNLDKALFMLSKLLILLLVSFGAQARMTSIGEVKCFQKQSVNKTSFTQGEVEQVKLIEGEFCTYTLVNLANVSELSRKIVQSLFNGEPLVHPFGVLEAFGSNDQTLIFSHQEPEILEQMKNLVPLLDTRENFMLQDVVKIKADIYEVNEVGLRNIGAGISNLRFGTGINEGVDNSAVVSSDGSGLGLDLRAGPLDISGFIQAEKIKGNLKKVTQVRRASYNLHNLSYEDVTTVYQAPGQGINVFPEEEGIKLKARVSINKDFSNTVVLKDFEFYFGMGEEQIAADGSVTRFVNKINIPASRLVLQDGVLVPIISKSYEVTSSSRRRGFLRFGNESNSESKRLLIYLSSEVLTWKDFLAGLKAADTSQIKTKFSEAEKAKLPEACPSERELLSGIKLFAKRGDDGAPVLSFGLDKSLACKSNLKKRIHINTRGGGISKADNTHIRMVEELMHIPVKISGIQSSYFNLAWIEFRVALNIFRNTKTMVYHNLVYSRNTGHDITDHFWVE